MPEPTVFAPTLRPAPSPLGPSEPPEPSSPPQPAEITKISTPDELRAALAERIDYANDGWVYIDDDGSTAEAADVTGDHPIAWIPTIDLSNIDFSDFPNGVSITDIIHEELISNEVQLGKLEEWADVKLGGSNFTGKNLAGLKVFALDAKKAKLQGANLSNLVIGGDRTENADFTDANLQDAQLVSANIPLGVVFNNTKAQRANFTNADLGGSEITNSDCRGADFSGASLYGSQLTDVILANATLKGTSLIGSSLVRVDFDGADIEAARIFDLKAYEQTSFDKALNTTKAFPSRAAWEAAGSPAYADDPRA